MQLFYHPQLTDADKEIVFSKDESRHIVKVLRKSEADEVQVSNGKGSLFHAKITMASANACTAEIFKIEKAATPRFHLHLIVAPTKMNDRYEWFLEKATEIGLQEVTPIICTHSERKVVKPERFERVLQSAVKQSLQLFMPQLNDAVAFSDFIKMKMDGQKFIAHCDESENKVLLKNAVKPNQKINILIGPEGDFSAEEVKQAVAAGWQPVSLGNSRLRTETAAIVAAHTVGLANED